MKPCTNCHSEPLSMYDSKFYIFCGSCGLSGPKSPTKEEAEILWDKLPRMHDILEYISGLRHIKEVCNKCRGLGVYYYPNTATYKSKPGIISGQAFTADVCDICWGSGSQSKPWRSWILIDEILKEYAVISIPPSLKDKNNP